MEIPLASGTGNPLSSHVGSVLIIGAGRIASGFDHPASPRVLTHAHAWRHLGYRIVFVDPDLAALEEASRRWEATGYSNLQEALDACRWDAVVVAAPDEHHPAIIEALAERPWGVLILEKPPAPDRRAWETIQERLAPRHDDVAIHFSRRWAKGLQEVAAGIHAGKWGDFLFGRGMYGNGLLHNASHMTDLLTWFLGPLQAESVSSPIFDRQSDPSAGFHLSTKLGRPILIDAVDSSLYTVFEVELVFSRGRLRMQQSMGWIEEDCVVPSPDHSGYTILAPLSSSSSRLDDELLELAKNVHDHLMESAPLGGTLREIRGGFDLCLTLVEMRNALKS